MQPMASSCCLPIAEYAVAQPKSFLFLPNACPSRNDPESVCFGTLLSFFISIPCSGLKPFGAARVTPRLCPPASAHLYEQMARQNPSDKVCIFNLLAPHVIHSGESLPVIAAPLPAPAGSSLQTRFPSPPA